MLETECYCAQQLTLQRYAEIYAPKTKNLIMKCLLMTIWNNLSL